MSHLYDYPPTTIPTSPAPQNSALYMVDDFIRCSRCRFGGCDVKVNSCGCSFHARCFPTRKDDAPLKVCPACGTPTPGFSLYPMNFAEIDEARKSAALAMSKEGEKRSRKRKNSVISQDDSVESKQSKGGKVRKQSITEQKDGKDSQELRTGRWTLEEMAFCDKLIICFKDGLLPVAEGTKLNDFLASVLRSKQSRLTKKMKNAKLSSNTYTRKTSFIDNDYLCFEFSSLEENFFLAIADSKERAELKFHMRKLWREMFSNYCLSIGQPLDVDAWLSSVEEMDRRKAMARDATRMQRRKLMMGYALCQDSQFAEAGVFIERSEDELVSAHNNEPLKPFSSSDLAFHPTETEEMLALLNDDFGQEKIDPSLFPVPEENAINFESVGKSSILHSSPFLSKVMSYIKRHNVPFEHVDVWVPNYQGNSKSKCILGFAGSATSDQEIPASGKAPAQKMDADSKFNLLAFGDYSQKFSFSVGCGLPGRVFESCTSTWEAGSHTHFERSGGAAQWGIKTVVGIPIPSPNVGRIVAVLYSRHARLHNQSLVSKLQDEFSKLLPTPKWKLVIDMGNPSASVQAGPGTIKPLLTNSLKMAPTSARAPVPAAAVSPNPDPRIAQIVNLLADELSSSVMNHPGSFGNDMISLRLMLLKTNRSPSEEDLVTTILGSYSSYNSSQRPRSQIATMVARDYSFMTQNQQGLPQVSLHHIDYTLSPPPSQGQFDLSPALGPMQCQSNPTMAEFSPLDPKVHFYSIEGADLNTFRSNSPALTPIETLTEKTVDNLSVVSN
eukprot:CAMPEP_0203664212 /NCGR_PEP_ID=MMETSP0090-20130426/1667_1 /ASSEMBLY_ACC=CAM_ASM_001088 /TAXON_ID=426623 /ORGANISM="Chaetoceros affinis, Strain CCMP159" /LENGTH=781 /DNA_ID=CAMNT_0050527375 /DNA_START=22 /DNA_END=2367 /DNA_ORIENTATION=+